MNIYPPSTYTASTSPFSDSASKQNPPTEAEWLYQKFLDLVKENGGDESQVIIDKNGHLHYHKEEEGLNGRKTYAYIGHKKPDKDGFSTTFIHDKNGNTTGYDTGVDPNDCKIDKDITYGPIHIDGISRLPDEWETIEFECYKDVDTDKRSTPPNDTTKKKPIIISSN